MKTNKEKPYIGMKTTIMGKAVIVNNINLSSDGTMIRIGVETNYIEVVNFHDSKIQKITVNKDTLGT